MSKNKKAFTLIELLLVIAIVGILSGVVLVSLSSSRSKARDAQRKSDLNQMAKLLQVYRANTNNGMFAGVAGYGYINRVYGGYSLSFNQGLIANGAVERASFPFHVAFSDPKIPLGQDGTVHNYMLGLCTSGRYAIYAELENPTAETDATMTRALNSPFRCYNYAASRLGGPGPYFMNYAVIVE